MFFRISSPNFIHIGHIVAEYDVTNPKPEVKLRRSGRRLENRYDIITPKLVILFG